MIFIISEFDLTTDKVMEWLIANNTKVYRYNFDDFLQLHSLSITCEEVNIQLTSEIKVNDITKIWHRRAKISFIPNQIYNENFIPIEYLKNEEETIQRFLEQYLKQIFKEKYIGSYIKERDSNKLTFLEVAAKRDCFVPKSLVTGSKEAIREFYECNNKLICKSLRYLFNMEDENYTYKSKGTFIVTEEMIDQLEDYFFPVYVQEYIEKAFEVRVFFFKFKYYSMAIFSNSNDDTIVDYRMTYDTNRSVPFVLPQFIEDKLRKIAKDLKLDTGSFDIIVTPDNDYFLLEVNPSGQLDWLSENCNYYIEKEIAVELAKN